MHIDQEMLHHHHHHIIIVIITIIVAQHAIDFWVRVWSPKPSVIMAAAVLRNKLEFIILYTHRL